MLDLDRFLPYLLVVLASRTSRSLAAVYEARFGISIPEWRVLAHLAQNRDVSVREIHERVDMDKSKVSRAAARLEAAGLIEKRAGAADRRLVALGLTAAGEATFAAIVPLALAHERELLSVLEPGERAVFTAAVGKLLAATDVRRASAGEGTGGTVAARAARPAP